MITTLFKNIAKDNVVKIVLTIFIILMFFKQPDFHDIDVNTILILFNLMLIIEIVKETNILNYFSALIINHVSNSRQINAWLVILSFFGSMIVTNDVAIITLVPLYILIAKQYQLNIAYPVSLITIAANMGSAVTPIGNPQNVFLVENFQVGFIDFMAQSLQILFVGIVIMIILVNLNHKKEIGLQSIPIPTIKRMDLVWVIGLFTIVLLSQFNIINILIPLILVIWKSTKLNPKMLVKIDYSLLITFVFFFLIVGMISKMPIVSEYIDHFIKTPQSTFLTSIGISQIISNVPCAVLIAKFSGHFSAIYWGVSIGGLGTLVASLANLLAFKQIANYARDERLNFIKIFTGLNIGLLIILIIIKIILI
ncbi:MAG: SLC13 family permease [Apilactobacillus sp.]|uniref:SLC13 family permease n=1 Tax=Apilactobacillus TaxID=2767877 RepID=UPI0025EEB900|nr:SLC13 family permease [Apilactobacillus sp.]MCT6822508.1 SLC13 family permease [Apilactobacillus sp.]MCT6858148.1 SLC13 family permease [Apilactobacillus sp.]